MITNRSKLRISRQLRKPRGRFGMALNRRKPISLRILKTSSWIFALGWQRQIPNSVNHRRLAFGRELTKSLREQSIQFVAMTRSKQLRANQGFKAGPQ